MSQAGHLKTSIIRGFAGENTVLPDVLLGPNIGVNALNCDYGRQTLRKRRGFVRLDERPALGGGIVVRNGLNLATTGDASAHIVTDVDAGLWANAWAMTFTTQLWRFGSSITTIARALSDSPGANAFHLWLPQYTHQFTWDVALAGGGSEQVVMVTVPSEAYISPVNSLGSPVSVVLGFVPGSPSRFVLHVSCNGEHQTAVTTNGDGKAPVAIEDVYLGGNGEYSGEYPEYSADMVFDEFRLYSLPTFDWTSYQAWLDDWEQTGVGFRELLTHEQGAPELARHHTFNNPHDKVSLYTDDAYTDDMPVHWDRSVRFGQGVCFPVENALPVSALVSIEDSIVRLLRDAIYPDMNASPSNASGALSVGADQIAGSTPPSPWTVCKHEGRVVAARRRGADTWTPDDGAIYLDAVDAEIKRLTPAPPASETIDISVDGTPLEREPNRFRFYYKDSTTGTVSARSPFELSAVLEIEAEDPTYGTVTITGFDTIAKPRPEWEGVDTLQIFRTGQGGSVFHLVHEYDLTDLAPENYSHSNLSVADTELVDSLTEAALGYDRMGTVQEAGFCVNHDGYLVLGNVTLEETHLPDGIAFSDRGRWDAFHWTNYRTVGNPADPLTGGLSAGGTLLLTTKRRMYVVHGTAPSTWVLRQYTGEFGCLAHNTLVMSATSVYGLGPHGVFRIPLPLGSGVPTNITRDVYRELFEGIGDHADTACGAFHPGEGQYWVSFDHPKTGERVTLVYTESTGAWARTDLAIDAYAMDERAGAPHRLLGAWNGYVVELTRGHNDGVTSESILVDDPRDIPVQGTVSDGGAYWLEDSEASFNADPDNPYEPIKLLHGVTVALVRDDNTSIETRRVVWHTDTRLYVDPPFDTAPQADDLYLLGGIDWRWASPLFPPDDIRDEETRLDRVSVWSRELTGSCYMLLSAAGETYTHLLLGGRLRKVLAGLRGMEYRVSFEDHLANNPVEIEAIGLGLKQTANRP